MQMPKPNDIHSPKEKPTAQSSPRSKNNFIVSPYPTFTFEVYNKNMLKLSKTLINYPIMSLRAGGQIATTIGPVINPDNLKIVAWAVQDRFSKEVLYLMTQDIRETLPLGFAINDLDSLSPAGDLIRLKDLIELNYSLIGKYVTTENNKNLGKVSDYAVEVESMLIQKIYFTKGLIKGFTSGESSIDRSQVIETTKTRIIIEDATVKAHEPNLNPANA